MSPVFGALCARQSSRILAATTYCSLVLLFACRHEPDFAQGKAPPLQVESSSFVEGGAIPAKNTCDGANLSPALQWSAPPAGTRSIAIVMHDPDALLDFTHWIVFNLPPGTQSLPEGASKQAGMPQGSLEAGNDFGASGYGGPCPPGGKRHRYIFLVYALDLRLGLSPGAGRRDLDSAISGHILAMGRMSGTYRHSSQ